MNHRRNNPFFFCSNLYFPSPIPISRAGITQLLTDVEMEAQREGVTAVARWCRGWKPGHGVIFQ